MTALRDQMIRDMQLRNLSKHTQRSYITSVKGLAQFYHRSPDQLSMKEVQDYLFYITHEKHLTWTTCNSIRHGIQFLYYITLERPRASFYLPRAKEPLKLPEILSHEELVRLFTMTANRKHRALLMTVYGAGLRAGEVVQLRVTDINSARMCIRVQQGKGQKDRYVPLAPYLLTELRDYWRLKRPPEWLFPGTNINKPLTRDAAWGAYIKARDRAGITKKGGIHLLRHCFATHLLEAGTELPVIQRLLGHTTIRSTFRYLHLAQSRVDGATSPLELLELPGTTKH